MKQKGILAASAIVLSFVILTLVPDVYAQGSATYSGRLIIDQNTIGFQIPSFAQMMSFLVKFFFVLAGLLALFYMLWGAISYVTSGGDKEATGKAQQKIISAVIGVILIIATLAIIAGLEQIVFKGRLCFGVTCELRLPTLLKCPDGSEPNKDTGACPGDTTDTGAGAPSYTSLASKTSGEEVAGSTSDQNTLPKTGQ